MNNNIAFHVWESKQMVDWPSTKVKTYEMSIWKRKFLEVIEIRRNEHTFNLDCVLQLNSHSRNLYIQTSFPQITVLSLLSPSCLLHPSIWCLQDSLFDTTINLFNFSFCVLECASWSDQLCFLHLIKACWPKPSGSMYKCYKNVNQTYQEPLLLRD